MTSAIDPTKPIDGIPAVKADLRANLLAARNEIETLQSGLAALRNAGAAGGVYLNVLDFGAVGDNSSHNAVAIQAAIDAVHAAGGGTVFFPPGVYRVEAGLTMRRAVRLLGSSAIYPATNHWPVSIRATGGWSGTLLDWPPDGQTSDAAGVTGINFRGASENIPMIGARIRNGSRSFLVSCNFWDFADQAIVANANVTLVQDCSCSNTLRGNDRVRDAKSGCLEIKGADIYVIRGEYNASMSIEGTVSDANLRICAILVTGWNNWIIDAVGEISDVGIHVSGNDNRIIGVRADLNYGHGVEVTGQGNLLSAVHSYRNSRALSETYDGFSITGRGCAVTGCVAKSLSSDSWRHRYGFHDAGTSPSLPRTTYSGNVSERHVKAYHKSTAPNGGHIVVPMMGMPIAFSSGDTTPSVDGHGVFVTANAGATSVTTFDDAFAGQRIMLVAGDADTTIVHGSGITTNTGENKALVNGRIYNFYSFDGTTWIEE
jgi:hypothetical protein